MSVEFIECLLYTKPSAESFVDIDPVKHFYEENKVPGAKLLARVTPHTSDRARGETPVGGLQAPPFPTVLPWGFALEKRVLHLHTLPAKFTTLTFVCKTQHQQAITALVFWHKFTFSQELLLPNGPDKSPGMARAFSP